MDTIRALISWHSGILVSVVAALLLQSLLNRRLHDGGRMMRNNLAGAILCALTYFVGQVLLGMTTSKLGHLAQELAILCWGLIVLRLCGLVICRLFLPALGIHQPRIMEDIALVLVYFAWGLVRLRHAGLDLSGLITTSAVLTGIIAFSMQETLGNILGGLALQLDNTIRIGDWISVDNIRGQITEVHWRHTTVITNNGEKVVFPNSILMKSKVDIRSSTAAPLWRRWVNFSVSNHIQPQRVISAVEKAIVEADIPHVAPDPTAQCIVMDYRDGSAYYALRYWLESPAYDDATDSKVRLHIYVALQREGFNLARPCLDLELTTESAEKTAQTQEKELQHRLSSLSRIALFQPLNIQELNAVANSLRDTPFTKGDVITHQGATAHWLYILTSGEADVWYETQDKERKYLATLKPGDIFGEMGLMTGEPRRATVTARTDVECYRLDKKSFQSILLARPELSEGLAYILSKRNQELANIQKDADMPVETKEESILANIRHFFGLNSDSRL